MLAQRAVAQAVEQAAQQAGQQAGQQTHGGLGASRSPPAVLWLRPANRELEAVSDALREALAKAWRRGVADGWRHLYGGADSAQALPATATALCVQCGGGCCAHGAKHHAFVDADVLARWQAAHPGSSTEDAIADYLGHLPALHVKHGCAFQTATGCALPRQRRADVCNRYACEPLQRLAGLVREDPDAAAVVLTPDGALLERAALLQGGRLTPLTGLPQPDDLPVHAA